MTKCVINLLIPWPDFGLQKNVKFPNFAFLLWTECECIDETQIGLRKVNNSITPSAREK